MVNIKIIENGRTRPISTVYNYSSDQSEEILFDHFPILIQFYGPYFHHMPLKSSLNRRPTLIEMYRAGVNLSKLRQQNGDWWNFMTSTGDCRDRSSAEVSGTTLDLSRPEQNCFTSHQQFFAELETTKMTNSYKMVLLESLMENDGFCNPPTINQLSRQAFEVFRRRRKLRYIDQVDEAAWRKYWEKNPVNVWNGGNISKGQKIWFAVRGMAGLLPPSRQLRRVVRKRAFKSWNQKYLAAPFTYYGEVFYKSHEGSNPMSVVWKLGGKDA